MTARKYQIASLPGDGIGKEVLPVGEQVVNSLAQKFGFDVTWKPYDWSCERYAKLGSMMPDDAIDQLKDNDAIFLGACGFPGVDDHVSLWGMLIPMRRELDLYINLRPVKLLAGVSSPLANRSPEDIDFIIVRENVEGEYSEIGGRMFAGTDKEMVSQQSIFTRQGVDRVMDYAFELAKTRTRKKVTSATKSNGIIHTMPYWDERFAEAAKRHPGVETDQYHIDILTAHFVQHPDWFDVVVGSNLFGDILSDLGPALAGSIGIAPGANINPDGKYPSLFEPVHGSAPDIAGQGIANPIAMVWTAAMMLEHLKETEAAQMVERAIAEVVANPATRTKDLGGNANTKGCADALIAAIESY